MNNQPTIFEITPGVEIPPDLPIDRYTKEFLAFHKENPHVYKLLVRFSRQVKAAGFRQYSIQAIIERARWHTTIETQGSAWKISNNLTSRYARMIMHNEADLEGFFELRILKAEKRKYKQIIYE